MTGHEPLPPHLVLIIDHETVTGVEGKARDLIPPLIDDPAGRGLLDFVHPVDRATVGEWLREGLGASPAFRRAAADDPPRWFQFVAAETAPGTKQGRILFLDVTPQVRQETLQQRLNSVLARYVGRALVDRAPELAAEIAGATHGCLTELYPPVAIVRASYGEGMPDPGTTIPIHGTPMEEAASLRTMRILHDGVRTEYPAWPLVRLVQADSAIVIPILDPVTAETRAVLTCCTPVPLAVSPAEEELLDLLATRLASELGARTGSSHNDEPGLTSAENVPDDVLGGLVSVMLFDGVMHTLNNLFASQMLHIDLAAAELPAGSTAATHLERVAAEASRGARLVGGLGILAHEDLGEWQNVNLDQIVRSAVELVGRIHGAADIVLSSDGTDLSLWVERLTFIRLLASLLAACVTMVGEAGKIRVSIREDRSSSGDTRTALVTITATAGSTSPESLDMETRARERLELGLVVARRFAGRFGGRVTFDQDGPVATISISLPAYQREPDGTVTSGTPEG